MVLAQVIGRRKWRSEVGNEYNTDRSSSYPQWLHMESLAVNREYLSMPQDRSPIYHSIPSHVRCAENHKPDDGDRDASSTRLEAENLVLQLADRPCLVVS